MFQNKFCGPSRCVNKDTAAALGPSGVGETLNSVMDGERALASNSNTFEIHMHVFKQELILNLK